MFNNFGSNCEYINDFISNNCEAEDIFHSKYFETDNKGILFYYYLLTPRVVYTNKTLQIFYTVSVWSTIVHLRSGSSLNRSPISRNMG